MSGTTRGRLPARVYWVRRLMVLGIAALLVLGVSRMLTGSGGGAASGGGDRAAQMADTSSGAADPGTSTSTGPGSATTGPRQGSGTPEAPSSQTVVPSGPCGASDVAITASVPHPVGGSAIAIDLSVTSLSTPACSWTLSASSLAMRITSGSDLIWTTAQCARSIPTQDLVVRQDAPTTVKLEWDARRSEPGCPVETAWALPGTYHLEVAALGGQPQEATFLLTAPSHDTTKPHGRTTGSKKSQQQKKQPKHQHKHHKRPPG